MTEREVVHTERAPAAIGPYHQAIRAGGLVFASGQIPLVPGTKALVEGGIAEQTEQALRNLTAVLEAAGSSAARVVKTTVYLADMADFAAMNEVYGRHFPAPAPARATVAVRTLPMNARVEIDAIALAG
jgi:2-iminobutanoate/2-iminopropanoate deaminase